MAADTARTERTTQAERTPPTTRAKRTRRRIDGFELLAIVIVGGFGVLCLLPFLLVVSSSLTSERALIENGYTFVPGEWSLEAYQTLLSGPTILQSYGASIFITVVGTALALLATTGLAYVIAVTRPRLSRPLSLFTYIPMLFSGGLVPLYILVTQYLELADTYWSVILPLMVSPFLVFISVSYFRQIPADMLDAARIDGASELKIFTRIVLPVAKPILATVGLFYALTYWNEWFMPLLFISDSEKFPLQLLLQNLIANVNAAQAIDVNASSGVPIYQLRMALTVVTIGPILLAYPFVQRYFVKGLTLGATKG